MNNVAICIHVNGRYLNMDDKILLFLQKMEGEGFGAGPVL